MGLKWTEILLILVVVMLLFGSSRLPQLGSSLGSAIRNFKRGFAGDDDQKDGAPAPRIADQTGAPGSIQASDKASSKQS
jgi:sec-independent protein translocase protein TatA